MAKKIPRRLVALSSSAVAAVYFAGLLTTEPEGARRQSVAPALAAPDRRTIPAPPAAAPQVRQAAPAPPAAPAPIGATAGEYRDGTYTGSGTSRRGGVAVAVTIHGGRISGVAITGGTTHYPLSRIATLPGEVVTRQSVQVDRVTGATYSAQAFQQAVQQALARASGVEAASLPPSQLLNRGRF